MKMRKRLFALATASAVALSLFISAPRAAAADVSETTAEQVVSALNIMTGDENGNMLLDSCLTRGQFAKVLIRLAMGNITLSTATTSPFPDVPFTYWASPYISKAVGLGYLNGYPDATYKPDNQVKTEEVAKGLLAVLGYSSTDYGTGYPSAQVSYAQKLGLFDNVTSQVGSPITRRDVMYMVYNTLCAKAKSGNAYIKTLGYNTDSAGTGLDVNGIIETNSTGPMTVKSASWYGGTGLNTSSLHVYLDDSVSTLNAIGLNDVVYYSVNMNTVWAYDKKVTGVLQETLPSRISPTSVILSGTTYTVGSTAAAEALGYSGGFSYGDTVTLLLDRSGNVADVVKPDASGVVDGYVTGAGNKSYTNSDGSTYYSYYITLVTPDGSKLEYQVSSDESAAVGTVVSVSFSGGTTKVSGVSAGTASGRVSSTSMTVGAQKMSDSIKILDVDDNGNYVNVFPQRIDGVNLTSDNVLYCRADSSGGITELILKNVTGDTLSYGILTSVDNNGGQGTMSLRGSYAYNIGGNTGTYTTSNTLFPVTEGPASFAYKAGAIQKIAMLNGISDVSLLGSDAVVSSAGVEYHLSDKAVIYEDTSNGYAVITASQAAGMKLTAYYDKAESDGGRIRVIIAQ